ncbi:MAG TPA: Gfo/Idh/MocA family oxidoreductase [Bryobacteraceae bacterium]|jgi:predicted dehydrogenase|nr:Gfo/Idh/MocA family oxidoreductase [Bryobacteraceae bacterium]
MNRRAFVFTAASFSRILGANNHVRVGLIGSGGRGRWVAENISKAPNTSFTAFCDVDEDTAAKAKAQKWAAPEAKQFSDFRKLLELKELDAVLVATPDHWHAIPTIYAIQAGKHVYVEKPLAHNIREGQAIVKAARNSNKIVMPGTQQRSATHFPEVADFIQSGRLGKVAYVRVWNFINMLPDGIGHAEDEATPPGLDWDMYLGPAPKRPFNRLRFQRTYRWFWDYAGGFITDFGTHRFDTVHQIMGSDKPLTVSATGGRYALKDDGEFPDMMQVTYQYPDFVLSYEACTMSAHGIGGRTTGMKYYNMKGAEDRPHGMAFYGTNGAIFADRIGYEIYPDGDKIQRSFKNTTDATPLHGPHFIAAIRGEQKPRTNAETGHRATIIGHLGNIAFKTGRKLQWDAETETIKGDAEATQLMGRVARKPWDVLSS